MRGKQKVVEIKDARGVDLTVRRVQKVLRKTILLQYSRPIRALYFSKFHKEEHLKFAESNLDFGSSTLDESYV